MSSANMKEFLTKWASFIERRGLESFEKYRKENPYEPLEVAEKKYKDFVLEMSYQVRLGK